ncbi:unnamed protein product [Prorocentrum cordatum]|uniref:Uncharacterized protein n=1 Tax=Prorocentrum cordatum TaxID=2364126 RepID=A0ABN9XQ81_9DINO|nr:unnamed protein product [Polarella glacialis]
MDAAGVPLVPGLQPPWRGGQRGWRKGRKEKDYRKTTDTYAVCSCGHYTWDHLLAKRGGQCVHCRAQLVPPPLVVLDADPGHGHRKPGATGLSSETVAQLREMASKVPEEEARAILSPYGLALQASVKQPELPETEYVQAQSAKREAQRQVDRALDARKRLEQQIKDADKRLDDAVAADMQAAEVVAAAAKRISARVLPSEPPKSVVHMDALLRDGGKAIFLELGEELDLSGPEFSDEDRDAFTKFKNDMLEKASKLITESLAGVVDKAKEHKEEYANRIGELKKKRKQNNGNPQTVRPSVPGGAGAAASGAPGGDGAQPEAPEDPERAAYMAAAKARAAARKAETEAAPAAGSVAPLS